MQPHMHEPIHAMKMTHLHLEGRGAYKTDYGVFDPKVWRTDNLEEYYWKPARVVNPFSMPYAARLTKLTVEKTIEVKEVSALEDLENVQKLRIAIGLESEEYLLRSLARITRCKSSKSLLH